jgi:protein-tyrosine phosphatase
MIDIHTHLLPGIDDGVRTRDESSALLVDYQAAGFRHIVCTPHIANPFVKTAVLEIRAAFEWFRAETARFGIEAHLGSELFIGPAKSKYIPFLERFILVETYSESPPLFLLDRVFELQLKGFTVILAHIERYEWFSLDHSIAVRLREMGVLFQVNCEGLENGSAKPYLNAGWVDIIASDNHGPGKRKPVNLAVFSHYSEIMEHTLEILGL